MILVTVGAQMPFDRLVRTVDEWAADRGHRETFAQIGRTTLRPKHLEWVPVLDPSELRHRLFEADVVVTHAGMGTMLTALELGKPVIVMPRRGMLRETRNDHQLGTAAAFEKAGFVTVARDERDLPALLDAAAALPAPRRLGSHASLPLLTTLREFIAGDRP